VIPPCALALFAIGSIIIGIAIIRDNRRRLNAIRKENGLKPL
jgi:hypothetical protein